MSMAMAYATKKRAGKGAKMDCMAEGGEVGDPDMKDADMIARIMHKRKEYSQGGMVANDTPPIADDLSADYDDLALRDDLEDDSSAGNEEGDGRVHDDAVDRVMLKRKKDKLPRPA